MTSPPRHQPEVQPLRRRPLRTITKRNAKLKREMPLVKAMFRKKVGPLPPRTPTLQRRTSTSPKRHAPVRHLRYSPSEPLQPGDVITHELSSPKQFDNAVRIFTTIPSLGGPYYSRSPCLYGQDRDQLEIQLRYSRRRIRRVVDKVNSRFDDDNHVRQLKAEEVRCLQEALVRDIRLLCASRIAISSDMLLLCFMEGKSRPRRRIYPLLDTFNLDICADDDVDWAELERDLVRKVEAQFQLFEFLTQAEDNHLPKQYLSMQFDPGDALRTLRVDPPVRWCAVIHQVSRYTPEVARYTIEKIDQSLRNMGKRARPSRRFGGFTMTDSSDAISHLLRLSTPNEGVQQDVDLLKDRASLRIIHAALLVHLYAKAIEQTCSEGLLQLDDPGPAESYTSCDNFDLVSTAYREAREAIKTLHDTGGELGDAEYYIRGMCPTIESPSSSASAI
ncbi:hypothetical protein F5Y10DRAFT_290887 [Nemania abortiva]|nr:hypothetical protein F5Y10DRAFT_290887 [Nemania abortiva]